MHRGFSVDRVIGGAFSIYRQRLGRLLWTAAVLYFGGFVATALLVGLGAAVGAGLGSAAAGALVALVPAIGLLLAVAAAYSATVIKLVEAHDSGGELPGFGDSLRAVETRIWPLIWVQLLVGVCLVLVAAALAGVGAGIGVIAGGSLIALAIGAGVGGFLALVPVVYLMVIWAVVAPVIVIEGKSFDALARSRQLVRGSGLSVLGVGVIFFALNIAVSIGQSIVQAVAGQFLGGVVGLVGAVLFIPVGALLYATVYFELVRVEAANGTDSRQGEVETNGIGPSPDPPSSGMQA